MRILASIVLLFSLSNLYSQISRGGSPLWPDTKKSKSVYQIPQKDIHMAIQKDFSDEEMIYGKKPLRVAANYNLFVSPETDGEWITLSDGMKLWRIEFMSEGAFALNLSFDEFQLTKAATVFLYNPDRKNILGGFNYLTNKESGSLTTAFLPGDRLVLEMQVEADSEYGKLSIGSLSHAFVDIFGSSQKDGYFGKSGNCEIDINCPSGYEWQLVKNAVCRIVFKLNGSYTEMCTGSLINSTAQDETPFVYTANHCIRRALEAGNAVFYFGLESEECDGADPFPSGSWNYTISSSTLLATSDSLDFSLLKLSEQVPESYNPHYAGWSIVDTPPVSPTTIHHPQGDVKKISKDFDDALLDYQEINPPEWLSKGSIPSAFWRIEKWEEGATEPGSSGAPLFNEQKQIVGNLTGGDAACGYEVNDYFSKFHLDWDYYSNPAYQLKYWLDSLNTGITSMFGYPCSIGLYALQSPDYKNIISYIEKAGYSDILNSEGQYTFFALPDTSINKLPLEYINLLDNGPNYVAQEFVDKFLVSGEYSYADLLKNPFLTTISGDSLTFVSFEGNIILNDSLYVLNSSRELTNGFLHFVDVLFAADNTNYKNWHIYPNPNNGEFFVYSDELNLENLAVKLYDRMGKLIGEQFFSDSNSTSFNFSNLPSGVYIAEIKNGNIIQHQKIIIVK